jgi:hypothetical protein
MPCAGCAQRRVMLGRTLRAALRQDAREVGHQLSGAARSFMTDAQRSALALQRRLEDAILRRFDRSRSR